MSISGYCFGCGKKEKECLCSGVIEPVVGAQENVMVRKNHTWEGNFDHYVLPPIDSSHYNVLEPSVEPQVVAAGEDFPKEPEEPWEIGDENLYKKMSRCWCRDCPWHVLYKCCAVLWLAAVIVLWLRSNIFDDSYVIKMEDSRCMLLCSQLVPPTKPLSHEKESIDTFHCKINKEKWEGDIFGEWRKKIDSKGNQNCFNDCKSFRYMSAFLDACVKNEGVPEGQTYASFLFPGNALAYVDSIRGHWHWIIHVIVITNALSLFILLVPLFFCCHMVAIFTTSSVVASATLTSMLWYDLSQHREKQNASTSQSTMYLKYANTIAASLFCVYVFAKSVMVLKRFRISCAMLHLSSDCVNAMPTLLLEALISMVLLFLWIVAIIIVSLGIESSALLYVEGTTYFYELSPFGWIVRMTTFFFAYWTAQTIINCQTIVIHGATTRYYFERNRKNKVLISHSRMMKYHMCTAIFAGLLFNWLYWVRWLHEKTRIRSRSLYAAGAFGNTFCPGSKRVSNLLRLDGGFLKKKIDKANHFFFLLHIFVVMIIAIVCKLVFSGPYSHALWPDLLMLCYSYFVGLAAVNIYRVTKDAIFLSYTEDRRFTKENPQRPLKIPPSVALFFGIDPRVTPGDAEDTMEAQVKNDSEELAREGLKSENK